MFGKTLLVEGDRKYQLQLKYVLKKELIGSFNQKVQRMKAWLKVSRVSNNGDWFLGGTFRFGLCTGQFSGMACGLSMGEAPSFLPSICTLKRSGDPGQQNILLNQLESCAYF